MRAERMEFREVEGWKRGVLVGWRSATVTLLFPPGCLPNVIRSRALTATSKRVGSGFELEVLWLGHQPVREPVDRNINEGLFPAKDISSAAISQYLQEPSLTISKNQQSHKHTSQQQRESRKFRWNSFDTSDCQKLPTDSAFQDVQ